MGLTFLLGSGISRDAGLPGVAEITAQVRSGEGVFLGTDARFHLDPGNPNFEQLRPRVEPVLRFLRAVDQRAAEHYQALDPPGRDIDYEELAFLVGQLHRAVDLSQENPGLHQLIRDLADTEAQGNLHAVGDLAEQAWNYVRDVTCTMLDRSPTRPDHVSVITDACHQVESVDLFTLNHDLMLETALRGAGVPFSDGFERPYGDLLVWNDTFSRSTRLFKLHGSISWWGYGLPDEGWRGYVTARATNGDAFHVRGPDGQMLQIPHDLRPIFLAGTFDKLLGYEGWVFPDQHYRFQEALRASNRLVVIGYGFRDQAINSRLIGWLSRAEENRMIVVHGNPEEVPTLARMAIENHWDRWVTDGRVRLVRSWVAEASWEVVAAEL